MKPTRNDAWARRGCSLLWSPATLGTIAEPADVVSLRGFFGLARAWPEELPCSGGRALVVAGLEGCLDVLSPDDAVSWMELDLKGRILAFQDEYQGDAALLFWLPSGRTRLHQSLASGDYSWAGHGGSELPLGRLLWAGAQADAERIQIGSRTSDPDGDSWVGLYHPRIS